MKQENNELKVIVKAKELAVHTIKLTSNCNKFPKKYRFTLCDRMQNKAMNIYELLLEANRTHLNNLYLCMQSLLKGKAHSFQVHQE